MVKKNLFQELQNADNKNILLSPCIDYICSLFSQEGLFHQLIFLDCIK